MSTYPLYTSIDLIEQDVDTIITGMDELINDAHKFKHKEIKRLNNNISEVNKILNVALNEFSILAQRSHEMEMEGRGKRQRMSFSSHRRRHKTRKNTCTKSGKRTKKNKSPRRKK